MKFGFIAHAASPDEVRMLRVMEQLRNSGPSNPSQSGAESRGHSSKVGVDFVDSLSITSAAGAQCLGKITYLSLLPDEITAHQEMALQRIIAVAQELEEWGADIIGLGGYTAIVGGRGKEVQKALSRAIVTTGNSYTVYTSVATMEYVLNQIGLRVDELEVTMIGIPGSICLAITKMLAARGAHLTLVGRRDELFVRKFLEELGVSARERIGFSLQIQEAVEKADIVFVATSTGSIIDQDWLKPGAIVIDIGEPKDVIRRELNRQDVLVLDGGRFNITNDVQIEGVPGGILTTGFYGCVGETVLLALEGLPENLSLGRVLSVENVERIGQIGEKHGFRVTELHSWGRPIDNSLLNRIEKLTRRRKATGGIELNSVESVLADAASKTWDRYRSHVNPVLVAVSEAVNYNRTYIKAQGAHVWDSEGNRYYDFVGGYGSVNVGHNHPGVMNAVRLFMEGGVPSLIQVSPGVFASALAENLAQVTPGDLEFTFFCNSGTEAVEGALKLARIYTGRHKFVSAQNSFHGKTFGSLSITGREKYQKYFRPLLPEAVCVPFGDVDALREVLKGEEIAAFIVEPVQGEGGVIVPPPGYLKQAERLCREYGTLLIADEIQTGLGRTGKLFAVEHEDVVPDIMTLSKSLGGGLVPIGAYITTREIWEKAYGNQSRYLLHTSTFGGNNLCTAVGLAALNVIINEKLPQNAAEVGAYLQSGLKRLAERHSVIKEVRGRGLMIGIEFHQPVAGGLERMKDLINSMIPFDLKAKLLTLPEALVNKFQDFISECQVEMEKVLEENFTPQLAARLLNSFGVLTIVTLNNPNVMRIQPPLIITREDADYFVQALDSVCSELSTKV